MDTEIQQQLEEQSSQLYRKERRNRNKKPLIIAVSVLVWCGLFYGGYYLATQQILQTKEYINEQIQQTQVENEQHVEELKTELSNVYEELLSVKGELVFIQEDIQLAGETVTGSNETKSALQERMTVLDEQLTQLQASIARLEDASR